MSWLSFFSHIRQWLQWACYFFRKRVIVEDALKILFEQEEAGSQVSPRHLAQTLNVPERCVDRIVKALVERDLAQRSGDRIVLTEDGRREALRVVRLHRLWEKYLAERTSLDPSEWHARAHVLEHTTRQDVVEGLVAQLGDPRFDPHGDPIPTDSGETQGRLGQPLTSMSPGEFVEITHMEDEPASAYRELIDRGLHLGARLQVETLAPTEIQVRHHGETVVLSPQAAANLNVKAIPRYEFAQWEKKPSTLADLRLGEEAVVVGIAPLCRGLVRRRLLDLGFVPGTKVRAELSSLGGDPTAFRVRSTLIALRKSQAASILVKRENETSPTPST